jgi:hypothetical protein
MGHHLGQFTITKSAPTTFFFEITFFLRFRLEKREARPYFSPLISTRFSPTALCITSTIHYHQQETTTMTPVTIDNVRARIEESNNGKQLATEVLGNIHVITDVVLMMARLADCRIQRGSITNMFQPIRQTVAALMEAGWVVQVGNSKLAPVDVVAKFIVPLLPASCNNFKHLEEEATLEGIVPLPPTPDDQPREIHHPEEIMGNTPARIEWMRAHFRLAIYLVLDNGRKAYHAKDVLRAATGRDGQVMLNNMLAEQTPGKTKILSQIRGIS